MTGMGSFRTGLVPLVGRLLMAAIFVLGGYSKIGGFAGVAAEIASRGLPLPEAGASLAILIEFGGGVLIAVGLLTRPTAAVLGVWCLVTAALFHFAPGDQAMMVNFIKNVCMAGGFLQLVAWGGGAWSLDAMRGRTPMAAPARA
jgi:putative oxidoreductase